MKLEQTRHKIKGLYNMKLTFSEQIETIRKRKNISRQELAQRLDMSVQNMSQRLQRNTFKIEDMQKWANALDCDLIIEIRERAEGREG